MRTGGAHDPVPEAFHHLLDVHRDQRLILDDQDIGRNLARDFVAGLGEQVGELCLARVQDFSRLVIGEALDRNQQEGLPGAWRQGAEIGGGALFPGGGSRFLRNADRYRGEEVGIKTIERNAFVRAFRKYAHIGNDCLQHRCNQGVPAVLGARYGA